MELPNTGVKVQTPSFGKVKGLKYVPLTFHQGHFQSAKLTASIRYIDENDENQCQITALVNLYKAKIPLFNGDEDGNVRFVADPCFARTRDYLQVARESIDSETHDS